jgi:hypothetical protein
MPMWVREAGKQVLPSFCQGVLADRLRHHTPAASDQLCAPEVLPGIDERL